MTNHTDLLARLDAAEARMAALSVDPPPGLTDADPATGERWDAGQAWAHVAEFVPFWQGELEKVVAAHSSEPVPFGRTKEDPGRVGYIEANRNEPPTEQMARLAGSLTLMRGFLATLSEADWSARGLHPRLGEMTVAAIVDRFTVAHLEEHADQLEKLKTDA
jgi:hypothetical protein